MIFFGTAVGPRGVYDHVALPSIRAVAESDAAILAISGAPSMAIAYNSLIGRALEHGDDVEAIVLLHDDVAIQDRNFLQRIRRVLRDPAIGVIGVIGGCELRSLGWWSGRRLVGRVWGYNGYNGGVPLRGEVDAVDGLLMVLSRDAMKRVPFDEDMITGFHGYDSDYCYSCRAAGLRVVVEPFEVYHDAARVERVTTPAYQHTQALFMEKWEHRLSSPRPLERSVLLQAAASRTRRLRSAFSPGVSELKRVLRDDFRGVLHNRLDRASSNQAVQAVTSSFLPQADVPPPPCHLCGAPMTRPTPERPLSWCSECAFGQAWPRPVARAPHFETGDSAALARQSASRLDFLQRWVPEGLLLDIGLGSADFVALASNDGYEAYGVEARLEALTAWAAEYDGFTVDAVTMFNTLERVDAPSEMLGACVDALAPQALLLVEVPNAASRRGIECDGSATLWGFDRPLWYFTPASLGELLTRAGFEVVAAHLMTRRVYTPDPEWQGSRADDRAVGKLDADLDVLRLVARPLSKTAQQ